MPDNIDLSDERHVIRMKEVEEMLQKGKGHLHIESVYRQYEQIVQEEMKSSIEESYKKEWCRWRGGM